MIEKKFKESIENEVNKCKTGTVKSIVKFMNKYKKNLDYIKSHTEIIKTSKNIENMAENVSFNKIILGCLQSLESECEIYTYYINEFSKEFLPFEENH